MSDGNRGAVALWNAFAHVLDLRNAGRLRVLPVDEIHDHGFYVQAACFPIPKKLEVYALTSQIYGDEDAGFGDSSEYGVGMNWYPYPTRNHRLNVQLLDVNKSPVSSTFGYYTTGQTGSTVAVAYSVLF